MSDYSTPSEQKAERSSLGDLFGDVTRNLSTLVRQEIELAKAELTESAKRAGKGSGLYGGAGYAALMAVLFLSIAVWWGLGYAVGNAWSAVIVAVIWAVIGLILFLFARREFTAIKGAPQTVESLKKIPETFSRNEENR
ncbi:MAG: phage holin family protein [Burkholderiaceae bacterium]|nr:phage holin family protein [Microbacteriaceae bacterium]